MKEIKKTFIVKTWNELTEEEKKEEIKKRDENIMMDWCDYCYECFKFDIEEVKSKLKYINFDDVYLDDNSQGFWIDSIKNLTINNLENKKYSINDIDFKIIKYIEYVDSIEFIDNDGNYDYFDSIEEMEQKHGFKQLSRELKKDVNILIDGINSAVKAYYDDIYDVPSEYINEYFDGFEFEYLK